MIKIYYKEVLALLPFLCIQLLFILVWTLDMLPSSLGYQSVTTLTDFIGQIYQASAMRAPSGWVLCPLHVSPSFLFLFFFEQFLTFWHHKIFQVHLAFSLQILMSNISPRSLDSFNWRTVFSLLLGCHCF